MKKLDILTVVLFVFCSIISLAQGQPEFKKYDIFSGFVEYNVSGSANGKNELYFDEWGLYYSKFTNFEAQINGRKVHINNVTISTPEISCFVDLNSLKGSKTPDKGNERFKKLLEAEKGDFDKTFEILMKEDGYTKSGNEKILGYDCDVWIINKSDGKITKWIWKGIELKSLAETPEKTILIVATGVYEKLQIPFIKFEPPKNIEWVEM